MSEPLTLGFDTSAAHCAAALLSGDRVIGHRFEDMPRGQAERLMPLMAALLDEAGLGWRDVARFGVGVGPGNFTGVRIAVAAARGLALGTGRPAIGVSRFAALAEGLDGPVLVSVAARGGAFHVARGAEPPVTVPPDALPLAWIGAGYDVVGEGAGDIAAQTGGCVCAAPYPLAESIARIAARAALPAPRPAPLYLRAPDAAPAAPPPALLP